MSMILALPFLLLLLVVLLFYGLAYWSWVFTGAATLATALATGMAPGVVLIATVPFLLLAILFGVPAIRSKTVTGPIMKTLAGVLPGMSETERVALEAGTVWWDSELFSGNPNWRKLLDFETASLSEQEQAFLDGPVEELCSMVVDWDVDRAGNLPSEVWDFIKAQRFFGMIIPKEFGGHGFSALAHSAVVTKVSSRSIATAVTVMVPNSLGPAELLLHYGTDEQKSHYLPRLARGEEIPCFALTEPNAGSDAASLTSSGVVCHGEVDGEEVVGLRLNWDKRYITLAPVATVLGMAFRMTDPDHLLGETEDIGITCASTLR